MCQSGSLALLMQGGGCIASPTYGRHFISWTQSAGNLEIPSHSEITPGNIDASWSLVCWNPVSRLYWCMNGKYSLLPKYGRHFRFIRFVYTYVTPIIMQRAVALERSNSWAAWKRWQALSSCSMISKEYAVTFRWMRFITQVIDLLHSDPVVALMRRWTLSGGSGIW